MGNILTSVLGASGSGGGSGDNDKVKVSSNDTVTNYLFNKLISSDDSLTLSELDDGGNEQVDLIVNATKNSKTYYVSPSGDDTNDGSFLRPFQTIQHAIDTATSSSMIEVLEGSYTENLTISTSILLDASIENGVVLNGNITFSGAGPIFTGIKGFDIRGQVGQDCIVTTGLGGFRFYDCKITADAGSNYAYSISGSLTNNIVFSNCSVLTGKILINVSNFVDVQIKGGYYTSEVELLNGAVLLRDLQQIGHIDHTAGLIGISLVDVIVKNGSDNCISSSANFSATNAISLSNVGLKQFDYSFGRIEKIGTCLITLNNVVRDQTLDTLNGSVVFDANATDVKAIHSALNYTPSNSSLDGHLSGIDDALGNFNNGFNQETPIMSYQDFTGVAGVNLTITQDQNATTPINISDTSKILSNSCSVVLTSNEEAYPRTSGLMFTNIITGTNTQDLVTLSGIPAVAYQNNIRLWYIRYVKLSEIPIGRRKPSANVTTNIKELDTQGLATDDELSLKQNLDSIGNDVASASTVNLDSATGNTVLITGTTGISTITLSAGKRVVVRFGDVLTITHGASLILPNNGNDIQTELGDYAEFVGYSGGIVRCVNYQRADGSALNASPTLPNITQLFWSVGDPTVSGNAIPAPATISGNTVIQNNTSFYQARLTTATNGISGKLEWNFALDLEDSYFATFEHYAGNGNGADGMIYYFGCDVSPNSAVGPTNLSKGIAITIDEYNDRLRVYVNGSQIKEVTSLTSFDNNTWQKWYVQVRGDFIEVYNINYGATWIFPLKTSGIDMSGTYHGVQAQTGGANNEHYARFIALYNGIKGGLVAS